MPGVTKEQIQEAREADLFRYLQFHEPGVLKRDGPNYRHKEHDSLVYVTGKGYWYWNSRGRSINALDYLVEIRGYGLVDAVNTLTEGSAEGKLPERAGKKPCAEGAGEKALFPSLGEAVRHLCGIIPAETGDQQPDNQPMLPVGASV